MPERPMGWRQDLENYELLEIQASPMPQLMRGDLPAVVDPRQKMLSTGTWPISQGNKGSCTGFGTCAAMECAYVLATGGDYMKFSRDCIYYSAQHRDGIKGDKGATIESCGAVVREVGCLSDATMPYSQQYNPPRSIKPEWREEAAHFKLANTVYLKTYESICDFLRSGLGFVCWGITWRNGLDKAVVESYSGRVVGGHCTAVVGVSDRRDSAGHHYAIIVNSWPNYGADGFAEFAPRCMRDIMSDRSTCAIGMSDMSEMVPRDLPWDYTDPDMSLI